MVGTTVVISTRCHYHGSFSPAYPDSSGWTLGPGDFRPIPSRCDMERWNWKISRLPGQRTPSLATTTFRSFPSLWSGTLTQPFRHLSKYPAFNSGNSLECSTDWIFIQSLPSIEAVLEGGFNLHGSTRIIEKFPSQVARESTRLYACWSGIRPKCQGIINEAGTLKLLPQAAISYTPSLWDVKTNRVANGQVKKC